ncbi:hypothetical protein [Ralstonia pseudosolanacearum]
MMEFMRWLGEFTQKSKAIAFACFVASLVAIVGPRFVPGVVPTVPKDWAWAPWLGLAFCGSLLAIRFVVGVARLIERAIARVRRWWATRAPLSDEEASLLYTIGLADGQALHLGSLNYHAIGVSRVEVKDIACRLASRGLLTRNRFSGEVFGLTAAGRQSVLRIERANAAAVPQDLVRGDWVRHLHTGQVMRVVDVERPLGPAVNAESLPVTCSWEAGDGRMVSSPFPRQALEWIDPN